MDEARGTPGITPESRIRGLEQQVEQLAGEVQHYRKLYTDQLTRCALLERGIIAGKKAERLSDDGQVEQLSMQLLGMMFSALPAEATAQGDEGRPAEPEGPPSDEPSLDPRGELTRRLRPTGRKRPPEILPRIEIEVIPDEVQRQGLDAFVRIGEEVSEVLERRRGALVVVRLVRPKFVRKSEVASETTRATPEAECPVAPASEPTYATPVAPTSGPAVPSRPAPASGPTRDEPVDAAPVLIAEPPERPIERGLAGPGLLADTLVHRWQDHLPLNRLEGVYAREGLPLARSTICGWHEQLADLVEPLIEAMLRDAFTQPYLCVDATGVLVQAEKECRRAHFWVLVAPERHVLYRYTSRHDSEATGRLLAGYKGYLVADAHSVYDHLYASGDIVEVGCRVGGGVAAPAPHRPGRADFPHPVPRAVGSLASAYL